MAITDKKPVNKQDAGADAALTEREKALKTAIAGIEKQFGKGSVMRLGDTGALNVESVSTGSLSLDLALGVGGVPRGRITQIYGPESSGKTTIALHIVAEAQKKGGQVAYIDVEHALDPVYAKALGVDIDAMLISQPDIAEDALEIAEALVRSGAIDVVVLDSVAAMATRAEIEGEMGEMQVGHLARLMSQALRKLTAPISKANCVFIFINQLRQKIGVIYGNPETQPGGLALKYYSSVILDVRRIDSIKSGSEQVGNRTRVKIAKNKVAPPFREAEFDIIYGKGVSRVGEILDLAAQLDVVQKSGAWYNYGELRLGQGRDNAKIFLEANAELREEIAAKVAERKDELVFVRGTRKGSGKGKAAPASMDIDPEDDGGL